MFASITKYHASNNRNNNNSSGSVGSQKIAASFRMGIAGATIAPESTSSQQISVPENNNDSNSMMLAEVKKRSGRKDFVRFESIADPALLIDEHDEARDRIHEDIRSACKLGDRDRADRLAKPRMSLLGKPLNYNRGSRRDARYRRLQSRIYNFLERPRGVPAVLYHVMVFLMVFTCLALSVFSTIREYEEEALYILFRMEILVVIWFILEFCFRLWSSGCRSRYQGSVGRLKFMKRPFCIIDIVTIAASLVVLGMGTSGQVFATSALRGLRFFQILRMVRMDRRGGTWKLLGSVVYAHRQELITTMYIGFLGLIFASFLVYLMEKDVNDKFSNFAQALWWGVITLCTVGYGDMVPETWQGKLIASFCALLGISFFALPAGILGSGFALKVQQQQRQKHMIRRRQPAATLIQSLWRCYAADEHSISIATWTIHQVPLPSPPPSRASSSFKHNASFVARLPTIRRHKSQSLHSPGNAAINKSQVPLRSQRNQRVLGDINTSVENLDEDDEPRCVQLTNQHKTAIRFIRKMKYFVARRKFKEALKPYDVKDVMEQYAAGHVDLLGRVKNVHNRLDQILGKQGSKAKDVYASKISLASRVVKVERQVADIEEKLDILIKAYMQDRERLLALPLVSQVHQHSSTPSNQNPPGGGSGVARGSSYESGAVADTANINDAGDVIDSRIIPTCYSQVTSSNITAPSTTSKTSNYSPITYNERGNGAQRRPPMHRGYSDLGNRVKKRVTLRSIPQQYTEQRSVASDDVVIVVPELDAEPLESLLLGRIPGEQDVCLAGGDSVEGDMDPNSPKTITESSIILMDEEVEDIEEEDLDCEGEMDESPPWDIYGDADLDADLDADCDETTEDTALLRTTIRTAIIVTPISPVSSAHDFARLEMESRNGNGTSSADNSAHLLRPDSG